MIDGKEEVGYSVAAHRRLRQDVPEADIGKITHELASSVREGKRVPPEEPLEGRDSRRHQGEPYQGQGGLPSRQTRVEEARPVSELPGGTEDDIVRSHPTPGIMSKTRAVATISQAMSPD